MSAEYLTIEATHSYLKEHGFQVTLSQLRAWATSRIIPFFKIGKRLYISEAELTSHLERLQSQAAKEITRNDHLKGALAGKR